MSLGGINIYNRSIDTIQVMCSVPQPDKMAKQLYRLLMPGGQLMVYEHIRKNDLVSNKLQGFNSLGFLKTIAKVPRFVISIHLLMTVDLQSSFKCGCCGTGLYKILWTLAIRNCHLNWSTDLSLPIAGGQAAIDLKN